MPWACASTTPGAGPAQTLALRFQDAALACDDDGHVYVAGTEIFADAKQIFVSASERYGESWSPRFDYVNSSRDGDRGRPQLAAAAAAEIYVLWEDTRHGRVDLYFNRSLDGGSTWLTADVQVNAAVVPAVDLAAPVLRCDLRGNVYVVWRDEREGFEALYLNRSRDRGTTWLAEPLRITSLSAARKSAPAVACDDDGGLFVAWSELEPAGSAANVFTNASVDNGSTWLWDAVLLGPAATSRYLLRPDLATSRNGAVFVGWLGPRPGAPEILLARSQDRGRGWDAVPQTLRAGEPLAYPTTPQLHCDRYGQLYVAWQALRADGSSLFVLKSSSDAAATFVETRIPRTGGWQLLQRGGLQEPRVEPFRSSVDDSGNFFVVWTEGDAGVRGVGFDRVSSHGSTWLGLSHGVGNVAHLPVTPEAPLLCADNSGHVFLLWNEGHTLTVAASPFYGDSGWRYEHF